MPTMYNLRIYLRADNQFLLVDELAGRDLGELQKEALVRKEANPSYFTLILEFKRCDAILI